MDAHGTKRVGRRVRASPKRPPKPLQKMIVFVPAFYAVEHKILKIEHQFYHFRVTKPKMWDNVQSDSFLGHFFLEKRNPCYYTGCPKGARIHHLENLKNRTLSRSPLCLFRRWRGFISCPLCMSCLDTMIYTLNYESWLRSPRDPCDE